MRYALVSLFAAAAMTAPAFAQETTTPAPEPAPPATPAEVAAPALPPTPNDPTTLQVLNVLDNVCKPLAAGGDAAAITKPLGFKKKRETFVLRLEKPQEIVLIPSSSNPNVCSLEIDHAIGGDKDMTIGLHNWAIGQGYTLYRNDEFTTDLKRHTRSWELTKDGKTEALVFITEWKADGSPLGKRTDHSTLMYSVRNAQ